jgi:hypothetical protein
VDRQFLAVETSEASHQYILERILQSIGMGQPLGVVHKVTPATLRDDALELAGVRVRQADAVVAAGADAPVDDAVRVEAVLQADPVKHAVPHAVRAGRVGAVRGVVARAGDLHDERRAPEPRPALLPHGQLGAVPVQPAEDDDERRPVLARRLRRQVVERRERGSLARLGVRVRDRHLHHGVLVQSE